MRIKELHLENFRGFEKLDIVFPEDSNVAVFIGENGSGKTTVLDAIVFLLQIKIFQNYCVGKKNGIIHQKTDVSNTSLLDSLVLKLSLDDFISSLYPITYSPNAQYTVDENTTNKPFFLSLYYARGKEQHLEFLEDKIPLHSGILYSPRNWNELKHNYEKANSPYNDAFGINLIDPRKAQNDFEQWFFSLENNELQSIFDNKDFKFRLPELETFRNVISTFFSNFNDIKIDRIKGNREKGVKVFDKTDNWIELNKNGDKLRLSQLSAGEQALLMFIVDITRRLLQINSNSTAEQIIQSSGIILIDEIELHLHPKWQRNILPALTKTFPNVQFIVTTHSPQIVSSVPNESIFVLKDNQLITNDFYSEGRDANAILQEAFGLEKRPKEFSDKLASFYQFLEKQDAESLQKAEAILKDLSLKWGTMDAEIIRATLSLQDTFDEIEA
jgi:predicted ATP-binding protein involved in virulence